MTRTYCLWSSIPYSQLKKILGFVCLFVWRLLWFGVFWGGVFFFYGEGV